MDKILETPLSITEYISAAVQIPNSKMTECNMIGGFSAPLLH